MSRPTALVTGASRGIGHASALALARAGYDVAVTARTLEEGQGRVEPPRTGGDAAAVEVQGSLATTAAEIESAGSRAIPIEMDLLSNESVDTAINHAIDELGRVDVLVNNAIWSGAGLLDRIESLDLAALEKALFANMLQQVRIIQIVLPTMIERVGGQIFNMTSSAGQVDEPPYALAEMGMLGLAHCASKGAFHRIAPLLQAEHAKDGIRAINLDPGFTRTESMTALGLPTLGAATPEVTGEVVAWLASHPDDDEWNGKTVDTHALCARLGLVEGWPPARS
jgi:NAD(P)-dependent dehydrogenase (short-subunit alcohol dehydrogenase family)